VKSYTSVYAGKDVEKISKAALQALNVVIEGLQEQKSSVLIGDKLQTFGWTDSFRLLVDGFDSCPLAYRNLILNSASAIYERCPLAVSLYLLTLQKLLKRKSFRYEELRDDVNKLTERRRRLSASSVKLTWYNTIQDYLTLENFETLCTALDRAGALGTIEIKAGKYTAVEIYDGVSISAFLHPLFSSRISEYIYLEDCKIVIVDGAILDVSELNKLLVYANESKTCMAIFATQFSENILNTLVVNWENRKLKVLPMVFGNKLDDLNQPSDLAAVVGTSIISKDVVNSLSLIDENEIVSVKNITIDNMAQKCNVVLDERGLANVFVLRTKIQQQRDKEKVDDVKTILNTRLARLTSRSTVLTLACETEEIGLIKDRSASLFTFVKGCANEGVIDLHDIYKKLGLTSVKFLPAFLPAFTIKLAILRAISDFEQMSKVGALILSHNQD